jgi:hypothetical protein
VYSAVCIDLSMCGICSEPRASSQTLNSPKSTILKLLHKNFAHHMLWLQEDALVSDKPPGLSMPRHIWRELEHLAVEPGWASDPLSDWVCEVAKKMNFRDWEQAVRDSQHLASTLISLLTAAIKHQTPTRHLVPVVLYATIPGERDATIKLPALNLDLLAAAKVVGFHRLASLTYEQDLSELTSGVETICTDKYEHLVLEFFSEDGELNWDPTPWFLELEQYLLEREGKLLVVVCNPEWWMTALVQCMRYSISIKGKTLWRMLSQLQQPGTHNFNPALNDVIAQYAIGGAIDARGYRHPDKGIQSALVEFNYSWSVITNALKLSSIA